MGDAREVAPGDCISSSGTAMTAHAKTVFEAEARARKCAAFVRAIDRGIRSAGETVNPQLVADMLRDRDAAWWSELARREGLRKPSELTVSCIIAEYDARADVYPDDEPNAAELAEIARVP